MARRFHRTRHHAGKALAGGKGTLLGVGAGAATGALSAYAISAVPFLSTTWWATPTALALVGHFIKRKNPVIGGALLGVAGYWGYNAFMTRNGATAKGLMTGDAGDFVDSGRLNYDQGVQTASAPLLSAPNAMGYADAGDMLDTNEAMGLQD